MTIDYHLEEIIRCYYCKEDSMRPVGHNEEQHFTMYDCDFCDKTFMMDWDKQNNWYKIQNK